MGGLFYDFFSEVLFDKFARFDMTYYSSLRDTVSKNGRYPRVMEVGVANSAHFNIFGGKLS